MEFIRSQRSSPNHDPNTRHVIYGLDADLIMLGLATHEPHFRVLREDVFNQGFDRKCHICGQEGHEARQCRGEPRKKEDGSDEKQPDRPLKPFIWLHVSILREYLEVELNVSLQKFRFDLERALDDWVFMCFFVGNDFLPHLPSLDIRENGIDTLIAIWKDNIPVMGGYVTCDGIVDLARAQTILEGLAKQEDAIFRRRRENSERQEQNNKRRKLEADHRQAQKEQREGRSAAPAIKNSKSKTKAFAEPPANLPLFKPGEHNPTATRLSYDLAMNRGIVQGSSAQNKSAAAALKEQMLKKSGAVTSVPNGLAGDAGDKNGVQADDKITASVPLKRKLDELEKTDGVSTDLKASEPTTPAKAKEDETEQEDTVRMWEPGYNARYYDQKFGVDPSNKEFRHQVARDYVEGLAWVLLYYFQGCPSWTWYYPYHYAPFAADFVNLEAMNIEFEKGVPFRPFEQLMGVLPAASRHAIPEIFHDLMTKEDSNIIDFYPEEFKIDMNGKKMAWQGIALLPFIDEKRLLSAMATKYPGLSDEEAARNAVGDDVLIVSDEHSLYNEFAQNFYSKRQADMKFNLNQRSSDGLAGKVKKNTDFMPRGSLTFPLADGKLEDVEDNRAMIVHYEMPKSVHIHKSMLMAGLKMPRKVLERRDIDGVKSRGRDSGRSYGGAPLHDNNPGSFNMRNINYAAAAKIQQPQYPSAPSAVTFPPPMHPAMLAQFGQQNGQASGLPFPPQLPPQFFTPHNSGGPPPPPPGYGGPPLRGGPVAIPPPSGFSYQGSQQNLGFQNRQNGFNR